MAKMGCSKEYNSRGAGLRDEGVNDNNITNMLGVVLVEKAKILKYIYI